MHLFVHNLDAHQRGRIPYGELIHFFHPEVERTTLTRIASLI